MANGRGFHDEGADVETDEEDKVGEGEDQVGYEALTDDDDDDDDDDGNDADDGAGE